MKDWEKEFVKEQKVKHELADKIWNIPFVVANLNKLTKKELSMLVSEMLNKIGCDYETSWFEMDAKDILFDQKCWLIEALDKDFFKKEKK